MIGLTRSSGAIRSAPEVLTYVDAYWEAMRPLMERRLGAEVLKRLGV